MTRGHTEPNEIIHEILYTYCHLPRNECWEVLQLVIS